MAVDVTTFLPPLDETVPCGVSTCFLPLGRVSVPTRSKNKDQACGCGRAQGLGFAVRNRAPSSTPAVPNRATNFFFWPESLFSACRI